ncbi:MAG: GNAT family N-acetyltransferase [Vagococcus fluvialis]
MLEYIPFNQVSEEIRTQIWNDGFSDYLRPIHMTAEQLNNRLQTLNLSEDKSFVVFENDVAKGITLYGVKDFNGTITCWIGGLAVHPDYRKEGIGIAMLDYSEKISRELAIDLVTLEVIAANQKALSLYQREGYKIARKVSFLKGDIKESTKDSVIKLIKIHDLTDEMDLTIPWQNRLFHGYEQFIIEENNKKIGYLVCQKNQQVMQVFQLSLPQEKVSNLLTYLKKEQQIETIIGVNLLSDTSEVIGLIEAGIEVDLNQFQLEKRLS